MLQIQKNKDVIEQVKKLEKRIDDLKESKVLFVAFLTRTQQLYSHHTKKIKEQIERFEESLVKKSFYSFRKCKEMRKMMQIFRLYCVHLEAVAKGNNVDLRRIDFDSSNQQTKLSNQSASLIKQIDLYINEESSYNSAFSDYDSNCQKLNQQMMKFKSYQNPIHFYSQTMTGEFSKTMDKKFYQCEAMQTILLNNLQVLDQRRKLLTLHLKQIKQEYVILLHRHMNNIKNSANFIVDQSKEQLFQGFSKNKSIQHPEPDLLSQEFQKFNDKYSKNPEGEDGLINDFKELFGGSSSSIQINSDYKLFLDRCETFKTKKNQSVQETLYLQKKFLKQIGILIKSCDEMPKELKDIEKGVFRSNGIDHYKKIFRSFFGENFLSIAELCFFIVENPQKRFQKIKKSMISLQQKLKRIIQQKEEEVKIFRKRVNMVLEQHYTAKQSIQKQRQINVDNANKFKSSVEKSFHNFRDIVKEFMKKQNEIDFSFDKEIKDLSVFIQKQSTHSFLTFLLSKQKQKYRYEVFKKINIDHEIILIIKEDSKYEVLFTEPLKATLFQSFQSKIDKKKYEQTKSIVQKKQNQSRPFFGEKTIGCCGIKQNFKFKPVTEHECQIMQNKKFKFGKLGISKKGIMFKEKARNPFSQKLSIMVPVNQMISFEQKLMQDTNGIEIITEMGILSFRSEENQKIMKSLDQNLGHRLSKQKSQARRDSRKNDSSFLKQNSSTQFKISFESTFMNQSTKLRSSVYKQKSNILKQLADRWKMRNFLSNQFQFSLRKEAERNTIRENFQYKDKMFSFVLKEKRKVQFTGINSLYFNYEWKISFPKNPMFQSYHHFQMIKVDIDPSIVKVQIISKKHSQEKLMVRKNFYRQVQQMNKRICDFVVEVCEREAQIVMQNEKSSDSDSQLIQLQDINLEVKPSENGDMRISRMFTSSPDSKTNIEKYN